MLPIVVAPLNSCANDDEKATTMLIQIYSVPRVLFGNHKLLVSSHKMFTCFWVV